ncbi:uncharacterized protein VTP21DRAFT_9739 [Calcarisporiella thermophila]|uniref:uncharacterized protein n=1 Tax=Calcarisporiella thermophila TaxID=911321 RepID=UPI00374221B0
MSLQKNTSITLLPSHLAIPAKIINLCATAFLVSVLGPVLFRYFLMRYDRFQTTIREIVEKPGSMSYLWLAPQKQGRKQTDLMFQVAAARMKYFHGRF